MFTSTGSQFFRKAALCALTISSLVNLLAIRSIQKGPTVDDSAYSYIGDDFPTELPIVLDTVEMVFEDFAPDGHFSQTGLNSWLEWHAVDYFPRAHGFVSLGPQGRQFGVSMFHQLHCLEMLRESMINGPDGHAAHCLNFLRQAILCNADTTLETGRGMTHTCRDWTQVYAYIKRNQMSSKWPVSHNNQTEGHVHDKN